MAPNFVGRLEGLLMDAKYIEEARKWVLSYRQALTPEQREDALVGISEADLLVIEHLVQCYPAIETTPDGLKAYHVTYYYLASGMEGQAERKDYGQVYASGPVEAVDKAARNKHPTDTEAELDWVKGCLTAKLL